MPPAAPEDEVPAPAEPPTIKSAIPIRTFAQWDDHRHGFVEVDLVSHDGGKRQWPLRPDADPDRRGHRLDGESGGAGRAYRKNDGCYVEQKNWAIVRQAVGYGRYDTDAELAASTLPAAAHELLLPRVFFCPGS